MAKRCRRDRIRHRLLLAVTAVVASWAATAAASETGDLVAAALASPPLPFAMSSDAAAQPGWQDGLPMRFALPLPEPSLGAGLRWSIAAAAPVAPSPPRAELLGWLPSILLAGGFAALQFGVDPPRNSRWTDRNGFDSGLRRALRGGSRDTRENASLASDVLFGGLAGALAFDWWWLREEHGLLRSVQVDTRWLLANNLVTRGAKVAAGRQRPYVQPCGRDSDYVSACGGGRDGNTGFFSGHASNAATLAGLLCSRHLHRREPGLTDALVCGGAAAGAVTTGVLRIVSEHHFATDVIAGWAVGAVFGYVLPSHFDYVGEPGDAFAASAFAPVVGRGYYGLQYDFRF